MAELVASRTGHTGRLPPESRVGRGSLALIVKFENNDLLILHTISKCIVWVDCGIELADKMGKLEVKMNGNLMKTFLIRGVNYTLWSFPDSRMVKCQCHYY